jgi:hypothetical protein
VVIWRRETENGATFVVEKQADDVDGEQNEQKTIDMTLHLPPTPYWLNSRISRDLALAVVIH